MQGEQRSLRVLAGSVAALCFTALVPTSLSAGNLYYGYDPLGRLSRVCNSLPGDGELTNYGTDIRDNRSTYSNTKVDIFFGLDTSIYSPDNRFQLRMQGDGNLVLYQQNGSNYTTVLWSSGTPGSGARYAYFQSDGNFVIYGSSGSVWYSGTYNNPCSHLVVQNDGNVVIYSPDNQVVWQTNTGGH